MKLLRFSDKVVNLDMVTDIRLAGNQIYLYFACTEPNSYSGELQQAFVQLEGIDAHAFQIWLRTNAETLAVPTPKPAPAEDIPF